MPKRKEKPLTLEEIKAKMIAQSESSWRHSPPLIGLAASSDGPVWLPLDPSAAEGTLLFLMLELGDHLSDALLETVSDMIDRYSRLPWRPVIAYQPKTLFLKQAKFFERYRTQSHFHLIPLYSDDTGDWFDTLQTNGSPTLAILHQGIVVFKEAFGKDPLLTLLHAESKLQQILRVEDPGLPLFDVTRRETQKTLEKGAIALESLTLNGNWIRGANTVMTEDSAASLSFQFEGEHLRLLANLHPQARDPAKFSIYFNDEPLASAHYGPHTYQGDRGNPTVELNQSQGVYEIIDAERPLRGRITLKFLNAVENPVILYSLRFA